MCSCNKYFLCKNGKFLKAKSDQNIACTKLHHFLKFSLGSMPRTHLVKRTVSPCASCGFSTWKFPNLKTNKLLAPPSPPHGKSWLRHRLRLTLTLFTKISTSTPQVQLHVISLSKWSFANSVLMFVSKCLYLYV